MIIMTDDQHRFLHNKNKSKSQISFDLTDGFSYRNHWQWWLIVFQFWIDFRGVDDFSDPEAAPIVQHLSQQLGRVLCVSDAGVLAAVEFEAGLFQGSVQTFGFATVKLLVRPFLQESLVQRYVFWITLKMKISNPA